MLDWTIGGKLSAVHSGRGAAVSYWGDKRVVVTGGAGFLGSFVVEQLRRLGPLDVFVPRSADYDLREKDAI